MNILPCFTPEELESLGIYDNENNFFTATNTDNIDNWHFYKATGCVLPDYYERVSKAYEELKNNPCRETRQALLNLGWNPFVSFCSDNIETAYEMTKSKLIELNYAAYTTKIVDFNESLLDTAEDSMIAAANEAIVYIQDIYLQDENNENTIEISSTNMKFDELGELIFAEYDYNEADRIVDVVQKVNDDLVAKGYLYERVKYESADTTKIRGVLKIEHVVQAGYLPFTSDVEYEAAATPSHKSEDMYSDKDGNVIISYDTDDDMIED